MGSLFRRGSIWWVRYYANGRPIRESAGTEKETEAKRFLKEREGRVATGQPILQRADRIGYEEVAHDLRQHYQTTQSRNLEEAEYRLKHLDAFFAGRRIVAIGSTEITAYVTRRQAEGSANATINRELAILSRMLRLAYENGKLLRLPVIRRLKENAPRQGFFEREQCAAVMRYLAPDLQVAVSIGYTCGWRIRSEVLTLERRRLDLEAATLRLEPGMTKNDEGRVVYLTPELTSLLAAQVEQVKALEREMGRIIPVLFPHLKGRHKGRRIQDFRRAWHAACLQTGCLGLRRDDFRCTAVRNMVNNGVSEPVAMTGTGDKSRTVFGRHHIVSPADLQDMARELMVTFAGQWVKSALTLIV